LQALVLRDWDPAFVQRRVEAWGREMPLLKACIDTASLPEPDPVWFDTPPENWFDLVAMPATLTCAVRRQLTQ